MATIPLQLSQRRLDTGNVVQYPGGGEIGRAMQGAGDELQQVAARIKAKQEEMDRFKRVALENEFDQAVANGADALARNAPADGSGIHDGIVGQINPVDGAVIKPGMFDNLAQQFRDRLPESQRGYFDQSLAAKRLQLSGNAAQLQYGQEQKYATIETGKIQDGLLNSILQTDPGDAASYDAYKAKGRQAIMDSPLAPLAKQAALDNWDQAAPKALAQAITARDPGKLRAMLGLGPITDTRLPAGMRNNNPGNIKYVSQAQAAGVVGPSANTDQGDPQAVFATPEAGMRAAYELAVKKYSDGKTTANQLIAGAGGWTPGNKQAASNIAATMGIGPNDDLNLKDPAQAAKFLRALVTQEHGSASSAYPDTMIADAVAGKPLPAASTAAGNHTGPDLPIVFGDTTGRVSAAPDMKGINPDMLARFKSLQNAFGSSLPIVSGYRDAARNERAGGAKASQHLHGNAFDLDVRDMSQDERIRLIQTARAQGFGGIGVYGNSIHIDTGPVRAWGVSHHSDSLPLWARDAVNTPVGAGSGQQVDPRFASLSPDDRISLANADDVAFRQKESAFRAQANADYASYKDSVELNIVQGRVADERLISSDPVLKDGDKATLIRSFREQNHTAIQTQTDLTALANGSFSVDPYASKDKTRVDNVYAEAMKHVPQEQQVAATSAIVQQTGTVPQPVINQMRAGLNSRDPAQVVAAAQIAQRISQFDPAALGRRDGGSEVQKAADDFSHMVNDLNLPPTDAAKRMIDLNDPSKRQSRKALEPAAKEFVKSLADVDIASEFKTGVLGGTPSLGITPEQEFGIKADFNAIAEDMFYAKNGDAELAKNAAIEQMKALYGVSDLAGNHILMKHPPERYWPKQTTQSDTTLFGMVPIPGTGGSPWQYAISQLHNDIDLYSQGGQPIDPSTVQLVSTPQTDADVKAGRMPGYAVMWKDANGNLQTIPGKLWRPDVSKMQAIEKANEAQRQNEANTRARQNDQLYNMNILTGEPLPKAQATPAPKAEPGANIPTDIPASDGPQTSFGNAM